VRCATIATRSNPVRPRRRIIWALAGVAALTALLAFALFVHPFLAMNVPVAADTVVIEAWVPKYVLDRVVPEIKRGNYEHVFVAGMASADGGTTDSVETGRYLVAAGLPSGLIVAVAAPETRWNRTSSMARAVRDRMQDLNVTPTGVNIVTLGPHGRQSLLAYSRVLGPSIPTGVITIPKDDYDAAWWWTSMAGIKKTTKDFAGWVREVLFGLRS
jgi:hypothetical protein